MSMPNMSGVVQKPHVPTLVSAIIAVVVIVVIYHLALGKKR